MSTSTIETDAENALKDFVRVVVPAAVGSAVAYLTKVEASLPAADVAWLAPSVAGAYFATITALEKKFPKFSWLLGAFPKATSAPVGA